MNKKRDCPYPLCVITWKDAVYSSDDSDANQQLKPSILVTVGWLIEENPEENYITVCSDYCPKETWVRNRNTIPLEMVQNYYEVEIP